MDECNGTCMAWALVGVGLVLAFRHYMQGGVFKGKENVKGRTVIVTGANTGIGKETAMELARRGGRVILACRDMEKGERARQEICQATENNQVILMKLDLASRESIIAFAKKILEVEDRLDILINNAGIMWCTKMVTEEGYEMQLGVNHMGHFLLTNLLLSKLKQCAPSRVVTVSSMGHALGKGTINFDDLNSCKSYSATEAYFQSKLANVLFTKELAKRLKGTGVTAYSLHPGSIVTELGRHMAVYHWMWLYVLLYPILWVGCKTIWGGAQTTLYCALDTGLASESGLYYADCKEKKPVAGALDEEAASRLWMVSDQWMKLQDAMTEVGV